MQEATITKTLVTSQKRVNFLHSYLGKDALRFEHMVYGYLDAFCEQYTGGFWDFYTLDNGGFFMAWDTEKECDIVQEHNYYSGTMSAEAASIAVCLYALNHVCWDCQGNNAKLVDLYHALRDFMLQHKEAKEILGFID